MITNERVYERAMRMGIEGRCVPREAIWDLATKQLAEDDRKVKVSMVGKKFATFDEYCSAALADGGRAYAMTYKSGKPEIVWFVDPATVEFVGWNGSFPVIR